MQQKKKEGTITMNKEKFTDLMTSLIAGLIIIALIILIPLVVFYGGLSLIIILVFGTMGIFTTIGQLTGKGKK